MSDPGASTEERLWLADWRRRVSDLYAEVRRVAAEDPEAAWRGWREVRENLYRHHPQSPLPPEARASFRPIHWPYDPSLRFEPSVEPDEPADVGPAPPVLPMSVGEDALSFERIGWVDLAFPAGPRRLAVYWMAGYAGGVFLPFRDATNGRETYPAGRYVLDGAKSADLGGNPRAGRLVVDFNFAFQPSCAFDPRWACPLAPPENRLDIEVLAGERIA